MPSQVDILLHRPIFGQVFGAASDLPGPIERYGRVPFCGLLCEEGEEDSAGLVLRPRRFTSPGGGSLPTVADG